MIIRKHGDIIWFTCSLCGCIFTEAVKNTDINNNAIWNEEKKEHGTRMSCPECGNDAFGFRKDNALSERGKNGERNTESDS